MNAGGRRHPWRVSFSFARALQDPALVAWAGRTSNVAAAQQALYRRARCNAAAVLGSYDPAMERETGAGAPLH